MAKFRKKPVVVEAIRFTDVFEFQKWVDEIINARGMSSFNFRLQGGILYVPTPEGEMRADRGDWIICGVKNEFYPCKADIFEMTYEPA